tara:strand:+ start:2083 stop:2649 length:567 start_codon:yes stop_codon:yes gene_type:complete
MKSREFKNILKELEKKNLAIMGHMGSGKSVLGKLIAKKLNLKHLDSDKEIVKFTNLSINKIFEIHGEKYFRKIEKKILLKLLEKNNVIISLGGGSIIEREIRKKLTSNSITLFLDVNLIELEKRLKKSINRPLLKNINLKKKINELDKKRRKYYLLSDIVIENSNTLSDARQNFIKKLTILNGKTNKN